MALPLSSRLTFFYKLVLPVVFAAGAVFSAAVGDLTTAVGFSVATAFLVFYSGRVKEVALDDNHLVVSNGFREARVPLHVIESIGERRLLYPRLTCIFFEKPSAFGSAIVFHPRGWSLFRESTAAASLRRAVQDARSQQVKVPSDSGRPA